MGSALHRHAQCVPMQLPYSTLLPGGDDPPQGARWDVLALRPHVAVLRDDGRGRSPQRPQSAGFCECPEGCCQLPVGPWAQLVFPACDGLGGSLLGGRGACPSTLGEHEQSGPLVAWIRVALDGAALDQVVNELGCSLLRDPEVDAHVCGGGVAGADAGEGEAVGGGPGIFC